MAFELRDVAHFIAGVPMAGVTVLDLDTLQTEFDSRLFPTLAPDVFTPVIIQSVKPDTFGGDGTAKQTMLYLIPYVLACYQQGEGRNLNDILPGIVDATSTVMTALINNNTPTDLTVDLTIQSALVNATVNDPGGNSYHGAKLVLLIKEFVEPD